MPELVEAKDLPFRTSIIDARGFRFGEHVFTPVEIVEVLTPLLTPERLARMEEVLHERTFNVATVIEHIYDIGNISAVMRSAESFGFLPFHIIERPEAKYKKSDRISKGSEKWLDIRRTQSTKETVTALKEQGYRVYATDLEATVDLHDIDFTHRTAVVFGNERDGISAEMKSMVDGCFKIPMYGFAQSFNISVAAALTFFHIHGYRRAKLGQSGDLTQVEKTLVKAHYMLRTLDSAEKVLLSSRVPSTFCEQKIRK